MAKMILTENQTNLLFAISGDKEICRCFYLIGGTALAEFYLYHRLSEDLDFFQNLIVKNKKGKFLLQLRDEEPEIGKWILPGGGVENNETPEQALVREIKIQALRAIVWISECAALTISILVSILLISILI